METMIRKEWGSPFGKFQEFRPQEYVAACEEPEKGLLMTAYWDVFDQKSGYNTTVVHDGVADRYCDVTYEKIESDGKMEATGSLSLSDGWFFNKTIYSGHPATSRYFSDSAFHVIEGYENATVYVKYHYAYIFKNRPSQDIIDMGTSYDPRSGSSHTKTVS